MTDLAPGNLVSVTRTLSNARGLDAGPILWPGTIGRVLHVSPESHLVRVDFGGAFAAWVQCAAIELAGLSVDSEYVAYLEDETARLEREIENLQTSMTSLLKPTGARLAHAGSGNGKD